MEHEGPCHEHRTRDLETTRTTPPCQGNPSVPTFLEMSSVASSTPANPSRPSNISAIRKSKRKSAFPMSQSGIPPGSPLPQENGSF